MVERDKNWEANTGHQLTHTHQKRWKNKEEEKKYVCIKIYIDEKIKLNKKTCNWLAVYVAHLEAKETYGHQ